MKKKFELIALSVAICIVMSACSAKPSGTSSSVVTPSASSTSVSSDIASSASSTSVSSDIESYTSSDTDSSLISSANSAVSSNISSATQMQEINPSLANLVQIKSLGNICAFSDGSYVDTNADTSSKASEQDKPAPLKIVRYDANGKQLWSKTYPNLDNRMTYIIESANGSICAISEFESIMTKISINGNVVFSQKIAGVNDTSYIEDFVMSDDGQIYFALDGDKNYLSIYHYNANGKLVNKVSPKQESINDNLGPMVPATLLYYKSGVGIILNNGGDIVCFDTTLNQKWDYSIPSVVSIFDFETLPANSGKYTVPEDLSLTSTQINFICQGDVTDPKSLSMYLTLDYNGKLVNSYTYNNTLSYIGTLNDGRNIMYDDNQNPSVYYFLNNGVKTAFDNIDKNTYPYTVNELSNGDFIIIYLRDASPAVAICYDQTGKIIYRKNLNASYSDLQVLPNGTILIWS